LLEAPFNVLGAVPDCLFPHGLKKAAKLIYDGWRDKNYLLYLRSFIALSDAAVSNWRCIYLDMILV